MRLLVIPLIVLAVGCAGPTRTAGTQGIPAEKLAILHVTSEYDVPFVELTAIQFGEGDKYKVKGSRDFYLTPGVHPIALDLTTKIKSPLKGISFGEPRFDGPKDLTTGDLQPGKSYELRGVAGTLQSMVRGTDLVITREMATK